MRLFRKNTGSGRVRHPHREDLRNRLERRLHQVTPGAKVPGPTQNPASNLLLADIVMRMGSYLVRKGVERTFLRGRYGKETAKDIVGNRSISQTLTAVAIAKFGTKSVPGALVVGTGLIAKTLYERSRSRRQARAEGDAELLEQAGATDGEGGQG